MATERYSHNEVPAVAGGVPSTQPHALNWSRAILGGLVGTVIIALMMYFMPPMMGMKPMDIGTMLGTMFPPHGGSTAFRLGLMMHFMMGIAFVLMYAAALLALRRQSTDAPVLCGCRRPDLQTPATPNLRSTTGAMKA